MSDVNNTGHRIVILLIMSQIKGNYQTTEDKVPGNSECLINSLN